MNIKINSRKLTLIITAIWIVLWVNFILRDLLKRGALFEYAELLKRDAAGRRSFVYGDGLYSFLEFAKKKLPEGASFKIVGIEKYSIEHRRSVYYLYPRIESERPSHILVFGPKGYRMNGFKKIYELKGVCLILERSTSV